MILRYTRVMEEIIFIENCKLKRKLDNLLRLARTNEQKQELFDSFGIEVISTTNPAQLRETVLLQMRERFHLQDVVMCLIDYDKDTEKLFYGYDCEAKVQYASNLLILDVEKHQARISSLSKFPILGSSIISKYFWMLENLDVQTSAKSAALLPLIRGEVLIGCLLLLSGDESRYVPGIATNFLQKLSAMTAVAIENCLNQQRIKEIGYQDPLTQAYNRRYFDLRFADEIERSLRNNENLVCMFLDVDFFKNVNDTYGHPTGDLVLTQLVQLIKEQVRACDIVARYGGEEFSIVLPGVSLKLAIDIAERLRQKVEVDKRLSCAEHALHVTVSIGLESLSCINEISLDAKEIGKLMLKHADKALYNAKATGRNQVVAYSAI